MVKKRIDYSPAEEKLLYLIPEDGEKVTTDVLTERQYRRREKPFNARSIVRATLTTLIRKVDHNREPFRINKGPRRGPHASEIWRSKS